MKTRFCIGCGETITGRADKKFCKESCKSLYHYQHSQEKEESLFKSIDKQLNKYANGIDYKSILLMYQLIILVVATNAMESLSEIEKIIKSQLQWAVLMFSTKQCDQVEQ